MGFCSGCGRAVPTSANFCPGCGQRALPVEAWQLRIPPPPGAVLVGRPAGLTQALLAPIWRRVVAWLADTAIVYVGLLLVPSLVMTGATPDPTYFDPSPDPPAPAVLLMALAVATALAYPVYFEGSEAGQTPGMRILGLRVLQERCMRPLGFRVAALRLVALVANLFGFGLLVALGDARRRTLRDMVAGTVMVRASAFPAPEWPGAGSWSGEEFQAVSPAQRRG